VTHSVRIQEFGGPEVLSIEEVETEKPGEGEVRMRIRAIGINRTEITLRSGRLPVKPPLPTKIGFEAAGEIEELGLEDRRVRCRGSRGARPCVPRQQVRTLW